MKTIDLHQVDAFTNKIFGGNPAGVVTNANKLSDTEMKKIAREMNLSETAFVLDPSSNKAEMELRYFTPTSEVDFCGHATVGTLYQLSQLGMFGLDQTGKNEVRVETGAGILKMFVTNEDGKQPNVSFIAPAVTLKEYAVQGQEFADKFGVPVSTMCPNSKILFDTNLNFVYIPITSLKQLGELQFNGAKIRSAFAAENIVVFCLFTNETFGENSQLHARVTGPLIGIDEDPFTGAVQSGLVHAAKQLNMIDKNLSVITTEQGNFVDRPGFALVQHNTATDEISVTANAAHVFSTQVEL